MAWKRPVGFTLPVPGTLRSPVPALPVLWMGMVVTWKWPVGFPLPVPGMSRPPVPSLPVVPAKVRTAAAVNRTVVRAALVPACEFLRDAFQEAVRLPVEVLGVPGRRLAVICPVKDEMFPARNITLTEVPGILFRPLLVPPVRMAVLPVEIPWLEIPAALLETPVFPTGRTGMAGILVLSVSFRVLSRGIGVLWSMSFRVISRGM